MQPPRREHPACHVTHGMGRRNKYHGPYSALHDYHDKVLHVSDKYRQQKPTLVRTFACACQERWSFPTQTFSFNKYAAGMEWSHPNGSHDQAVQSETVHGESRLHLPRWPCFRHCLCWACSLPHFRADAHWSNLERLGPHPASEQRILPVGR